MTKFIKQSESTHWYTANGEPRYTITGKNGKERNTTLRDARKENLLPSVTTILGVKAKPGLEVWKRNQLLLAALTLPKIKGETVEQFAGRIAADSRKHVEQACDTGTHIHGLLELYYQKGELADNIYVSSTAKAIDEHFGEQEWFAEKSFAHPAGYAGKVDLFSNDVVIDFKTKEFSQEDLDKSKVRGWKEQAMQLAAYRNGVQKYKARCANVFISVSNPGLVHIIEWTQDELTRAYLAFMNCLWLWQYEKSYMEAPF